MIDGHRHEIAKYISKISDREKQALLLESLGMFEEARTALASGGTGRSFMSAITGAFSR